MIERDNKRIKCNGEIFTPIEYVKIMIDNMGIDWTNPPQDKTFLDPTCGEGVFLLELAERGIPLKNLFGVDLMDDNVSHVKESLLDFFGRTPENIELIDNNIRCENAMDYDYSFS